MAIWYLYDWFFGLNCKHNVPSSSKMVKPNQEEKERIRGDRRRDRRYDIALDLRWKLIRRRKTLEIGSGRTIDLSSSGIRFEAGRNLPVGLKVQLSISWPVLLHGASPLQLAVDGRIVWTTSSHAAIRIEQHEFRTVGIPAGSRDAMTPSARPPFVFATAGSPQLAKVR